MLSIKFIRENSEEVKRRLAKKLIKPVLIDSVLSLDKKHRELQQMLEGYRAEQNKISEDISATKDNEEKNRKVNQMQTLKAEIKKMEPEFEASERDFKEALRLLPNMPYDFVPDGENETANQVLREVGQKPEFDFEFKDYIALGEELDIIDVKRAAKVSGSRFGYLKGGAARLEFALIQFALDILTEEGFVPVVPPVLVKPESMQAMGCVGQDATEVFFIEKDNLYLVGTSEQSIGPMHKDEVFLENELPARYISFSSCFRREAGSYGKDTRGILRAHQFDKLEMFSITKPEDSQNEHKFLLSLVERFMQALGIPYRVVLLCGGDMSRPSAVTYDIESWIPSQDTYRETHSISDTLSFQSLDLNIKYRFLSDGNPRTQRADQSSHDGKQQTNYVHMLNGTAFAIGRIIIAILENYQQADGSVKIPEVLQKYMGGATEISQNSKFKIQNS